MDCRPYLPFLIAGILVKENRLQMKTQATGLIETIFFAFFCEVYEDCAAVKVIIDNQTDEILGAHLFGPEYAELINIFGLAIKSGMKTAALKRMVSAYPSVGSDLGSMI